MNLRRHPKLDCQRLKDRLQELEIEVKWAAYSGQLNYHYFDKKIRPVLADVMELSRAL